MTIRRCSLLLLAALAVSATALADDHVGLYLGGSLGESQQRFDASTFDVRASDLAYKFALGYRPLKVLAAEVSYVGFGRAYGGINFADTDAIGAFAVAFLPIPVVDLYGKVGMANWRTDAQSPFHLAGGELRLNQNASGGRGGSEKWVLFGRAPARVGGGERERRRVVDGGDGRHVGAHEHPVPRKPCDIGVGRDAPSHGHRCLPDRVRDRAALGPQVAHDEGPAEGRVAHRARQHRASVPADTAIVAREIVCVHRDVDAPHPRPFGHGGKSV